MKFKAERQEKLLSFLSKKVPELSNRKLKNLIDLGKCKLNGKIETFATTQLKEGDQIELQLLKVERPKFSKEHILYEDTHLLVYDKPPFLVCDPKSIHSFFKKPLKLVHRLDKETSGVLILAKTTKAASALESQFKKRTIKKEYIAFLKPQLKKKTEVKNKIGVIQRLNGKIKVGLKKNGKEAITQFIPTKSYVKCIPITGRNAPNPLPFVHTQHSNHWRLSLWIQRNCSSHQALLPQNANRASRHLQKAHF